MKKLLAVALILALLIPCAVAEDLIKYDLFIGLYNIAAKNYGGFEISAATASELEGDTKTYYWETKQEKLIVFVNEYDNVSGVVVVGSRTSRDFLPMCFNAFLASSCESIKDEDYYKIMFGYFQSLKEPGKFHFYKNNVDYQYQFNENDNVLNIFIKNQDRRW